MFCKKNHQARSHQYINPDDVLTEEEESDEQEEIELFKTSKKRMHLQRERKRRHNKARSKNSGKSEPISTTTPSSSIDGSEAGSPSPPLTPNKAIYFYLGAYFMFKKSLILR